MVDVFKELPLVVALLTGVSPAVAGKPTLQLAIVQIQNCPALDVVCVKRVTGTKLTLVDHTAEADLYEMTWVKLADMELAKITLALPKGDGASRFGPRLTMNIHEHCIDKLVASYDYNLPFVERGNDTLVPGTYFTYGSKESSCLSTLVIERPAGKA